MARPFKIYSIYLHARRNIYDFINRSGKQASFVPIRLSHQLRLLGKKQCLRSISDVLNAMIAKTYEAERLIAKGDATTFVTLKPIILQMASAATGCFIACQYAIDQNGSGDGDLHLVTDGPDLLADRMRVITAVSRSSEHPNWQDCTAQARLLADLRRHIALTRRVILAMDIDGVPRADVR